MESNSFEMLEKNAKNESMRFKEMFILGVLSYICGMCSLPGSGVFTTLPIVFVLSFLSTYLIKNKLLIYLFFAFMPFSLNCFYGYEMSRSLVLVLICVISVFLADLLRKALFSVRYYKQNNGKKNYIKGIIVAVFSAFLGILLWFVFFGNPVNFFISKETNEKNIEQKYEERVQARYTYYDTFLKAYSTEITFDEAEKGKEYYFSADKKDDYRDFCLDIIYFDAADYFNKNTTIDRDSVKCYLNTENINITPQTDYREYLPEFEYFIEISDTSPNMRGFIKLYENLKKYITLSDSFVYKSITVCTENFDGKRYYVIVKDGQEKYFYPNETLENELMQKFDL